MKILVIDDSEYKIEGVRSLLNSIGFNENVVFARSFQSGMRALREFKPDLTILDMTIPTSETSTGELEGRVRIFGGRDFLAEIDYENITTKVIILTQFDRFLGSAKPIDLATLSKQLTAAYPKILDSTIYFSNVNSVWQSELRDAVVRLTK